MTEWQLYVLICMFCQIQNIYIQDWMPLIPKQFSKDLPLLLTERGRWSKKLWKVCSKEDFSNTKKLFWLCRISFVFRSKVRPPTLLFVLITETSQQTIYAFFRSSMNSSYADFTSQIYTSLSQLREVFEKATEDEVFLFWDKMFLNLVSREELYISHH